MKYKILLSICVIVLGSQITAAAEGEIPKFDITATCRGSGSVQTPAQCMQDEQAVRDQLTKLWPQFRQSDASRCIRTVKSGGPRPAMLNCSHACKQQGSRKRPRQIPSDLSRRSRNRVKVTRGASVLCLTPISAYRTLNVRYWHLADNPTAPAFVRYWSNSGHWPASVLNG
jgi:hypothetical protein